MTALSRQTTILAVVALLGAAANGSAQEARPRSPTPAVAHAAAEARLTRLRGSEEVMVGGTLLITTDGTWSFGGGGWLLPIDANIPGEATGSDLGLGVGYAGLLVRRHLWTAATGSIEFGMLLGAGNAKVNLTAVDTEIAADNYGVVEPDVLARRTLGRLVALQAGLAYRFVYGVEDLPGIGPAQLGGFSLGLSLSLGPF